MDLIWWNVIYNYTTWEGAWWFISYEISTQSFNSMISVFSLLWDYFQAIKEREENTILYLLFVSSFFYQTMCQMFSIFYFILFTFLHLSRSHFLLEPNIRLGCPSIFNGINILFRRQLWFSLIQIVGYWHWLLAR